MRNVRRLAAVLAAAALLAAGCGDDDDTAEPDPSEETDSPTDDGGTDDGEAGDATVAVADSDLGDILVDGDGRTLYMFTNDDPPVSNCYEGCASTWPPVEAPADIVAGDGVDETLLGTTDREDGSRQLTYADLPLYLYAADQTAGDTNGQGVGGVWYVVGPDGEPIR